MSWLPFRFICFIVRFMRFLGGFEFARDQGEALKMRRLRHLRRFSLIGDKLKRLNRLIACRYAFDDDVSARRLYPPSLPGLKQRMPKIRNLERSKPTYERLLAAVDGEIERTDRVNDLSALFINVATALVVPRGLKPNAVVMEH